MLCSSVLKSANVKAPFGTMETLLQRKNVLLGVLMSLNVNGIPSTQVMIVAPSFLTVTL